MVNTLSVSALTGTGTINFQSAEISGQYPHNYTGIHWSLRVQPPTVTVDTVIDWHHFMDSIIFV